MAHSECKLPGFNRALVLAVHGKKMRDHLKRATALQELGIAGIHVGGNPKNDEAILKPKDCWFTSEWGRSRG